MAFLSNLPANYKSSSEEQKVATAVSNFQKTAYQQNVSQPVQPSVPDTRQALGQIYRATQQDQTYGRQLQDQFVALQSDPGSIYYAPYTKQTNQAVSRLNELGIENVDRDWYDQTAFMDRYLNFNGQTNTPSAPTKKSSEMERIAYQRYQYGKSLQQTDDAIRECDALNEEINFLANWGDRNYSDDEIMDYLYANGGADFQKKYPTLAKMDSSLEPGQALMEFNEAIPYSKDWVYGRIWAARNNGGTGNDYRDMAMSALGEGKQWQENADIAGRLEWGSDSYAPYTVSSTTDDVCMYLGVPSYDRQYLMDHQPDMNDKTSVDMWNKGMEAVQFTETAQEEAAKLNERLNTKLQTAESVEEVMKWLDNRLASGEYDSLAKLDKSTDKINSLIDTSAPIDFSRNGIRKMAEEAVAKNSQKKNGGQTIEDNGIGSVSEQEAEAIKAGDKNVKEASDLINATDSEQNTFTNTPSTWFDRVYNMIGMANPVTLLKNNEGAATTKFANDTIVAVQDIMTNMKSQQQLDALNNVNADMVNKCDAIIADLNNGTGEFPFMYDLENNTDQYIPALLDLHEAVTGKPAFNEDGSIVSGALDEAEMFYEYISEGNGTHEEGEELPWLLPEFSDKKASLEADIDRTAGASQKNKLENFMWNARIVAYEAAGMDTTGLKTGRAVANSLYYFMDYDPTVWVENDRYNSMMLDQDGNTVATFDIVKGEAAEKSANAKEALDNALFIRDYINENGLEVPDNVRNNLDRYIAKLERDQKDYDYFTIQGNDDFAEYAEKGRQMDSELPRPQQLDYEDSEGFSYGSMMNQTEKDTYFYLLAKEGKDAATRYWAHLNDPEYGVISTRGMKKVEEQARELADKHPVLANALAVLSSPAEAFLGAAYMGLYSLAGMELNPDSPLLSVGKFSQFTNEETSKNIMKSVPEGPLRDLALGAYEIVYNQTRSMTNSFYTGGLQIGGRFGSILTESAGAVPMATGAAALAIADAKSKGATDGEAFIIGAVTFGMEDFSEGLTRSNIQSAFTRGGKEEVAVFAKQKIKEWLTSSGFEEAFGETLTDVVENEVEKKVLGERSDHAANVRQYIADNGLDPNNPVDVEKAENAVLAEEVAGYAHTAIISYLSPSISVATSIAKEGISDFHNIQVATRNMQKSGMDVSMSDVRKQYKEWKQAEVEQAQRTANAPKQEQTEQAQTAQAEAENPNFSVEDVDADALFAQQNNEAAEQTAGVATPSKTPSTADQAFLTDLAKLDAVQNSDTSTQAAVIGSLFGGEENTASGDTAKAAAANITNLFGSMQSAVEQIKNIVTCAHIQHISHEAVKSAIQTAVLSASSMANEVANSEEFKAASPMEQAQMIAETVEADQANETVQAETAKSVQEYRISAAEGELIRNGALDSIKNLKANMEKAQENVRMAEESLSEKQGEVQAKSEALTAANEAFVQDPSADNQHMVDRAANELDKASAVEQEYEQHLDNVNRANADAKARYEAEQDAVTRNIRQQAEAMVAQQDQQRAERDAQIAEQRRLAQEQAAQAQAEEDQRSGKAAEDQTRSLAEDWANLQHLEGEERENFIDRVMNIQEQRKLGKIDMTGKLNNAEGYLAIQAFARKTGLNFQLSDTLPDGARGMYQNGTVYLNSNLVKNGNMTIGQALVEASLHEIPHAMEQTKNYQTYRNVVLGSLFGVKGNQTAQQLYKSNAQFRAAVDQKIADYSGLQNLTVEGAEKEIVADFARLHLADKEVVQRFMDAGMGGKMRNTLHNINQALKNFFGGLKGEDRTQAEYLRRAERAFQKAMNELAKTAVHPDGGQFSIMQVAQATGMTFDADKLELRDSNGNVIDGVNRKLTTDDIVKTPVGFLIRSGLELFDGENAEQAKQDKTKTYIDPTSTAGKALEMMTGLMNMIARYKQSDLVWEIGASTLASTFSALKSNSDTQYQTTVDFGTICAKTQAIIDVMSQVMMDKIDPKTGMLKEGMKAGLTRKEIMKVYDATHNANLSVPCPVCYVFSRWMGVPSLLGQMSQFQKDYVVTEKDANGKPVYDKNGNVKIDWEATQKVVDEYLFGTTPGKEGMLVKYKDKDAINDKKTSLQNRMKTLEDRKTALEKKLLDQDLSKDEKAKIRTQIEGILSDMVDLEDQLGEVRAFNWVTQVLCEQKRKGNSAVNVTLPDGRYKLDTKNFRITPDNILFDLNRTSEFAEYTKNWSYRNTRGAGMGKSIMPYSGETIGDMFYNGKGKRQNGLKNPWLNYVEGGKNSAALRQMNDARNRAKQQNLLGGQRLQSTSDFRPEWGLDYIMSFLELQAARSKVQMYTKVAEAVDFFASVGADVNLSIMGQGTGWHLATEEELSKLSDEERAVREVKLGDKTYLMDFSPITGMKYFSNNKDEKTATSLKNAYDNVQMILVGMNDTHIRLAMANSNIDFIIPWHSSGNSKEVLSNLISAVGEKLNTSVDYTTTQSDMKKGETKSYYDENGEKVQYSAPGQQTEAEKHIWDLRMRILTGKANLVDTKKGGFTAEERAEVYADPWLRQLYDRFYVEGVDDSCYHVRLSGKQAAQIFPYEYWATGLVYDEESGTYKHDPNQKGATKDTADENGRRFVEYCERMGIIPRFSQFKDDPGYWKLLIDRPMYNNDGTYHQQQTINVTNARVGQLDENTGKLDRSTTDLPTQAQAVYAPKDQRSPMYEEYKKREQNAIKASENALGITYTEKQDEAMDSADALQDDMYRDGVDGQLSVYGDMTDADIEQALAANEDYMAAAERGDMETAQQMVNEAADAAGYTIEGYHGTSKQFTTFDKQFAGKNWDNDSRYGPGFYFAFDRDTALKWTDGVRVVNARLKMEKPFDLRAETPADVAEAIRQYEEGKLKDFDKIDHKLFQITFDQYKNNIERITKSEIEHPEYFFGHLGYDENGKMSDGIREFLSQFGYDGIISDEEMVVFDPEQIKSADPVVRDNNGNIIPLSERFQTDNPDIRYSTAGDMTDADIEQRLADAGVIPALSTDNSGTLPGMPVDEGGGKQRQFGRKTAQESDALHDDVKDYLYNHSEYTPDTNQEQINRAVDWVKNHANQNDPDGFFGALQEVQSADFNSLTADGQARLLTLMSMAALKGEQTGDHSAELLLSDMYNKQRTTVARALQAGKIFRLMTPIGRMASLQRMVDQINDEYGRNANERRVHLSDWTLQAAAVAETEEDFQKVRHAAAQELAEQMPANWKEKLQSLRMLAMLANTRTHIRNFLGNAMFIPAVSLKNKIGAGLEAAFVKDGERTKNFGISSKEVRAFARADAEKMESVLRGESKYNEGNEVQKERQIFKSKLLQGISEVNSKFLEGEDWFFLKGHYRRALGSYMMANNLTEADMTGKTLDNARAYAIAEAQKATYRDANELAKWLNNVKNPAARFVVNAILPFKKTPANILKRGVEYSPVSIIKALTTDAKHLKEWQAYQRGELAALPEKAISPAQYIDRLSSGLSGTAIMALGGLLNALGFVKAGFDDDDDEFDKMNGSQEYSIEIGGVSFTMDWAAPVCMPFFVGATIMDEAKKAAADNGEGVGFGKILDSMLGITEPVFNLSMLDGVNSLLNTNQYSDGNNITQIGEKIVTNYFTSYVPSALGALARSIDTTRRRNYVESGADLSVFRSALEQVENKIPWLSTTNIPYRDVWGNAEVSSPAEAIIENFISPGYGNALKNDPVNNELKRLYDATKNPNMIPKTAGKTVSINGNSVKLNAEQYDQYVVDRGQTAYQTIRDLMESPVWQVCDDNTRSMMVTDAWTYANQIARHNLDPNGKLDSWVANAQYNGNFVDVVVDRAAETNRKDYIAGYGQNLAEAREAGDKETYDLCMTALDEAGATSAEIRSPVRDYFKPLYQQAFEANDTVTMDSIEDMLIDIGIGFKIDDIRGWVPSEDDDDEQKDNTRWLNMDNN